MTQEEKQLLLIDLCARLPYGVTCQLSKTNAGVSITEKLKLGGLEHFIVGSMAVKPYLRRMLSMTEEERRHYDELACDFDGISMADSIDWLNKNMFDYRGLIEKDLALEAPDNMYNTE